MKKIIALILSLVMALSLVNISFASDYTYHDKAGWQAIANTVNQKYYAKNMIDGKVDTYWHSDYRSETDMDKPPFYLTFKLPEEVTVGGWRYIPRSDNSAGIVTKYNIYASSESEGKATLVFKGSFPGNFETFEVPFGFNLSGVKTVILEITEGRYNFGTCAEFDLMTSISSQSEKTIEEANLGKTVTIGSEAKSEFNGLLLRKEGWKATASSVNKEFTAYKTIDGNASSYWHSDYRSEADKDPLPYYLTYNLGATETIGGFIYTPRSDNSAGIVTEYALYASSSDSGKAYLIYEGKMTQDFKVKEIPFEVNISGVKTIIFEIKMGAYSYGTCAEFDLIKPLEGKETKAISEIKIGSKTIEIGTNKIEGTSSEYYENKASWVVKASSEHRLNLSSKAFDGNASTYWHTDYTDDGVATILTKVPGPHWLEVTLPSETLISGFTYVPRTNHNAGIFTGFEFYVAESDDSEWILVKSGEWKGDYSVKKEKFLKNLKVKKVKLISNGSNSDFGSCAELELIMLDENFETENDLSGYSDYFKQNKLEKIDLSKALATASTSWSGNGNPGNILDGSQVTTWHSDPDDRHKFPVIVTVDLGAAYTVSEIEYVPRTTDTTKHGVWLDFSVWASETDNSGDYFAALEGVEFKLSAENQKIVFPEPVTARYFEFEVNKGYNGYVTCADLVFYERAAETEKRESEISEKYVLQIDSNVIKTEKDGVASEKTIDVAPFIDSGYTQIPLRGLLEEMGASLTWDGVHQKIDIKGANIKIEMQIMNDAVYVTNEKLGRVRYTLQTPPQIKDSRTFVPLRFISENLGYKVEWNGETREITITK